MRIDIILYLTLFPTTCRQRVRQLRHHLRVRRACWSPDVVVEHAVGHVDGHIVGRVVGQFVEHTDGNAKTEPF